MDTAGHFIEHITNRSSSTHHNSRYAKTARDHRRGGAGGLVLARIVQVRGIPCAVYECNVAAGGRKQGGALDIIDHSV